MNHPPYDAPQWSACTSPQSQSYNTASVASPRSADNNFYGSPGVSPGEWNAPSPHSSSTMSPVSPYLKHPNYAEPLSNPYSPVSVFHHSQLGYPGQTDGQPFSVGRKTSSTEQRRALVAKHHQKRAENKAISLMSEEFGSYYDPYSEGSSRSSLTPPLSSRGVQQSSSAEIRRQRIAQHRQKTAQQAALGLPTRTMDPFTGSTLGPRAVSKAGSTVERKVSSTELRRKLIHDNKQNKASSRALAMFSQECGEMHVVVPKKCSLPALQPKKEMLASTSRKLPDTALDKRSASVKDFKCQLDLDREEDAKRKALSLLEVYGM